MSDSSPGRHSSSGHTALPRTPKPRRSPDAPSDSRPVKAASTSTPRGAIRMESTDHVDALFEREENKS